MRTNRPLKRVVRRAGLKLITAAALLAAATPVSAWAPDSHIALTKLATGRLALNLPTTVNVAPCKDPDPKQPNWELGAPGDPRGNLWFLAQMPDCYDVWRDLLQLYRKLGHSGFNPDPTTLWPYGNGKWWTSHYAGLGTPEGFGQATHYLEDMGNPYHTNVDSAIMEIVGGIAYPVLWEDPGTRHYAYEAYINNLLAADPEVRKAVAEAPVASKADNIYNLAQTLTTSSAQQFWTLLPLANAQYENRLTDAQATELRALSKELLVATASAAKRLYFYPTVPQPTEIFTANFNDGNISGWTQNVWGWSADAIADNGRMRLRVYKCSNIEVSRSLGRVSGPLTVDFDWQTYADGWYEPMGWKVVVDGTAVLNRGIPIGPYRGYSGHETQTVDVNGNVQLMFWGYQSVPWCSMGDHWNSYLWIDNVRAVAPAPAGQLALAEFHAPAERILAGDALTFDGNAAAEHVDGGLTFSWDFGDGAIAAGPQVTHAFVSPGSHLVEVAARASNGRTQTAQFSIPVEVHDAMLGLVDASPVAPGQTATIAGSLTNASTGDLAQDTFSLAVSGVDPSWVVAPGTVGTSVAGQPVGFAVSVTPPATPVVFADVTSTVTVRATCGHSGYTVSNAPLVRQAITPLVVLGTGSRTRAMIGDTKALATTLSGIPVASGKNGLTAKLSGNGSIQTKLADALAFLQQGNTIAAKDKLLAAAGQLQDFITQVNDKVAAGQISTADGATLVSGATALLTRINTLAASL